MFNTWDAPLTNTDFVSVVIISFRRPDYLADLLKSLHQHADMPFEVIVHDDASGPNVEKKLTQELRGLCSTIILGSPEGINLGFAASANRGVALANSEYVLFLNDDMRILAPPFARTKQVLDVPYVGCFGPWPCAGSKTVLPSGYLPVSRPDGLSFSASALPRGAGAFAFRKSVWMEVGGFPQVYTNAGDTGFMLRTLEAGYFSATYFQSDQEIITNVDQIAGYPNPSSAKTSLDSSYPHIFNAGDLQSHSRARKDRIYHFSHHNYYAPQGTCNHTWWNQRFEEALAEGAAPLHWDRLGANHQRFATELSTDAERWRLKNGDR